MKPSMQTRRALLGVGLVGTVAALTPLARKPSAPAPPTTAALAPEYSQAPAFLPAPAPLTPVEAPRRAFVHNLHTGDKLDAVYFENGRYVPEALAAAMRVLRDWRNGEEHVMDPRLFDVLHAVRDRVESDAPFQIISGYRSPASNAMMHERSSGVASHSQHLLGKALDIRVEGVGLNNLHKAAMSLGTGGVGLYPVYNFVHVDVGPVRHWQGV